MSSNGTRRLYVGNIPYTMDEDRLVQAFNEYGFKVARPQIVMDRETGRSKGFGFVEVGSEEVAEQACRTMDGARVDGRCIRVAPANERPPRDGFSSVTPERRMRR